MGVSGLHAWQVDPLVGHPEGGGEIGLAGLAGQQPWALSQLLARLTPVEWFYQVAGPITSMGALQSFQWFTGVSWVRGREV